MFRGIRESVQQIRYSCLWFRDHQFRPYWYCVCHVLPNSEKYSRSTVAELNTRNRDDLEGQCHNQENPTGQSLDQGNPTTNCGHKLFIAYCCQLSTRLALRVLFIFLQTQWLYPFKFPSKFYCYLNSGTNQPGAPNSTFNAGNVTTKKR